MKKIYIFIIVIILLLLYSCSNKTLDVSDLEKSNIAVDCDNINITVQELNPV